MSAYEDMIRGDRDATAPWYVIPADNKWFTRLSVASAIVEASRRARSRLSASRPSTARCAQGSARALLAEKGRD
jgi:hypothetical protein